MLTLPGCTLLADETEAKRATCARLDDDNTLRPASAASSSNGPRFPPESLYGYRLVLVTMKVVSSIQLQKSRVTVA